VVATNQSGLSRGYFDLDTLEAIHSRLCQLVEEAGGFLAGIFYCPHLPQEGCDCRKPATGLLRAIERELGESARGAWFVGDSLKDLQAARSHGCRPILVTTGQGAATLAALGDPEVALERPDEIPVYPSLTAAVDAILAD
jgi:D-glycero-D-manno-heptose 1,7-bisphosphate phosphatase